MRASEVIYDRADSLFAGLAHDCWDWATLLGDVDWLHVSGVTPALGPGPAAATLAAVSTARSLGIGVSFDGNWRGKLWERWNAAPQTVLRPIVEQADLMFGNHRDASLLLGRDFDGDGEHRRREAAEALLESFPSLALVASTARRIIGPSEHQIVARVDDRTGGDSTPAAAISPIIDRVGTGDAFAAGVLDGFWQGLDRVAIAKRGLAMSALKHGLRGDFATFSREIVEHATTSTADVAR
jgi:2-dehydro-3-deoxygluconokinase